MATPEVLREMFDSKLKNENPDFHPLDLERIKDDAYLKRFLKHNSYDLDSALQMMWTCFTWRKSMGVNELSENNINMDYINVGAIFPYGRDKDGCQILIFIGRMHNRASLNNDELKKCVIYWFERLERQEKGGRITLFVNCEGCGISNMDMENVKFLLSLFSSYYPYFLNNVIAFEVPWILNAAFKIVKQLIPPRAGNKLKMASRSNITEFVPLDQLLKSFGGTSEYVFKFEPENRVKTESKKVKFQDEAEKIQVEPSERIIFNEKNGDFSADFTVKNISDVDLAFKIRTTSPEKFRVKPSASTLAQGASQNVNIIVVSDMGNDFAREKFLILTVDIPNADITASELAELWQNNYTEREEFKLRCSVSYKNDAMPNGSIKQVQPPMRVDAVDRKIIEINKKLDRLVFFNYFLIVFVSYTMWLCFSRL